MQVFDSRKYSVRDLYEWYSSVPSELILQPKFQRRNVWKQKARSYLIDTIIRGKPIPKIFMRHQLNLATRRAHREIVDGQQRMRTVFDFIDGGFALDKSHGDQMSKKFFNQLSDETQRDILSYEFTVDLLQDMPDKEIYDIFCRLNTYSYTLNNQELRHAQYFGAFRTLVYRIANEFTTFWVDNKVFTEKQIVRMKEAEFASELVMAIIDGIQEGSKAVIDRYYRIYDDDLPKGDEISDRFGKVMDAIGTIFSNTLSQSKFCSVRLFYPLFCVVYHLFFKLPKTNWESIDVDPIRDFAKIRISLGSVEEIFSKVEESPRERAEDVLNRGELEFYMAYKEHWVHTANRKKLADHLFKAIASSLKRR